MRILRLAALLIVIAILCSGCAYECSRCKELEEEISDLEWKYENELPWYVEDEIQELKEDNSRMEYVIDNLEFCLSEAEEYLSAGNYAEALEAVRYGLDFE